MHNIMHKMIEDEMIANHIVMRGGVCRCVGCVPDYLRAEFPMRKRKPILWVS
jgi:activator of 2-hydroxyglutaryl-CoA dehydratase